MTDLNKSILQKASGEKRLDPDQQRLYMGTFRERVLLTLSFAEAVSQDFQDNFPSICQELKDKNPQLFLKISPKISDSLQISFMKEAQAGNITTTIVDEKIAASEFALVFHTDHAVDIEDVALSSRFPSANKVEEEESKPEKKSFWQKLFKK